MMLFRTIKANIIDILVAAEAGRYRTIKAQRQNTSGIQNENLSRTVTVFYSQGNFAAGGRINGPTQHDMTFGIELAVSGPAQGDLAPLLDSGATQGQKAAALANLKASSLVVDELIDELYDIIYQILMDGRNQNLGTTKGTITKRFINNIQKDEPVPRGELVILTGMMNLSCRGAEEVPGDIQTEEQKIYDTTIDQGANQDIAGAEVEN